MARARTHRVAPENVPIPSAFRERAKQWLPTEWQGLEHALDQPVPTSIRLNVDKLRTFPGEAVPWCANGRYLPQRPVFTLDPLLHAGCYYVQEASSMLLEVAIRASGAMDRDIMALDLCAAPGGKSTHLRSLLSPGSLLVANEVVAARRPVLCENLWKWGRPNMVVTGSPTEHFAALTAFFDLVLVDAPCSGEGMFRKDPFARQQWSPALVEECAHMQRGILQHAWECLRPGGTLIYSTCTWEPFENEAQVRWLLHQGAEPIALPMEPDRGLVPSEGFGDTAWRAYPHRVQGEGFFIAAVRKPGEAIPGRPGRGTARAHLPDVCRAWSLMGHEQHGTEHDGTWYTVHASHANELGKLQATVNVVAPGIPIAVAKGASYKPHPAWALNNDLARSAFEEVEADTGQTLTYLRGDVLRTSGAAGTALLTHGGHPIGWLHGAGTRWNNPWPRPWRIRMRPH